MFMLHLNLAIRTNDLYPTIDLSFYHQFPITHFFFCLFICFVHLFGFDTQHVVSQFSNQGLNLGPGSESTES